MRKACFNFSNDDDAAATILQSIGRIWLSKIETNGIRHKKKCAIQIQKMFRGNHDRHKTTAKRWRMLSVVSSAHSLKHMRLRSTEIKTIDNWSEMFDPYTNLFWYLNKSEFIGDSTTNRCLTRWKAPKEFRKDLTCYLEIILTTDENSCGGVRKGNCLKEFSNRQQYNDHLINDHLWICAGCDSENNGLVYPCCEVCGNMFSSNGENLEKKLANDIKRICRQ